MAKQVIVLERTVGDGILTKGIVWVAVPTSFQSILINSSFVSQFVLATSSEIADLRSGQIAEIPFQVEMLKSSTLSQQKSEFLRTASIVTVSYLSSQATSLQFYGVFWDGATWSA